MYHDVDCGRPARDAPPSATAYHVSHDVFLAHLDEVSASGLEVVTASEGLALSSGDSIVLTFDDGWLGAFETAVPLLLERGLRGTFYVTRDFVGRKGFCSEATLADAAHAGMEIGVHGTTHRMLSGCSRVELLRELRSCKEYLESVVLTKVTAASVPGGDWTRTIAECAREAGLTSLSTSRPGVNGARTSPFRLRRIPIRAATSSSDVARYCRFDARRELARWLALEAPRRVLGMQRYTHVRRRLLGDRRSDESLFDP